MWVVAQLGSVLRTCTLTPTPSTLHTTHPRPHLLHGPQPMLGAGRCLRAWRGRAAPEWAQEQCAEQGGARCASSAQD